MYWSYVLAAGGILGIWLAGRKNYWGWVIGLAMQGLWFVFAVATAQYGFVATALGYGWVYWVNIRKWRKESELDAIRARAAAMEEAVAARYRNERICNEIYNGDD